MIARMRTRHGWLFLALLVTAWWAIGAKFPRYNLPPDTITRNEERTANPVGKDYWHYFVAAEAMLQGKDIYESGIKYYIYPPVAAVLFIPLYPLGWMLGSQVFYFLMAGAVAISLFLLACDSARRFGLDQPAPGAGTTPILASIAFVGLLIASDSCRRTFSMIQTDPIILLCFVLGLVWYERRPSLCGAVLGFAATIKYHAIIMLPYLVLRRQWRAAGAYVASLAGFALLPAVWVGWDRNLAYWQRALGELAYAGGVSDQARSGTYPITWEGSVSIPSAIARAAQAAGLSPDHATLALVGGSGALAAIVAGVVWWMYARRGVPLLLRARDAEQERVPVALEWAGLIVATLIFSPQTTKRHMLTMAVLGCVTGAMIVLARVRASTRDKALTQAGMNAGEYTVHNEEKQTPSARWLIAGVALVLIGMYLPPKLKRNPTMMWAVDAWNAASIASWCLLTCLLIVVWQGLRLAHTTRQQSN